MRSLNTFRKSLLLPVFAIAIPCYAIDPHREMSQYVRDHWGAEQGFPHGAVYAITQTSDGYLWIGTETGLYRFDGAKFLQIQGRKDFAFTSVVGLTTDNDGNLWVGLRDMTLLRYRNGEFDNPFPATDPAANITAMARTKSGEMLVARAHLGAFTFRSGALASLATAVGVPRSPIIAIAQTANGDIWIGTRGTGLFRLRGGQTYPVHQGLPDPKIDCLLPDGNDIWVGTDDGVVRWNGAELSSSGLPTALKGLQILALTKDRDGNIWVGTDSHGLMRLNADGLQLLDQRRGESENAITSVFEDREGSIWIGSADGLERLRDSAFVTYSVPEGLPTDGSTPVFVDAAKRIWFPPVSGGLWWMKDGNHGQVTLNGIGKDVIYSLAGSQSGNENLWLGRRRGGLTYLHKSGDLFRATTYTSANGLAQNSVYSVYEAHDGSIWAGTLSGGVSHLDHGAFVTYTAAEGLASNTVASILQGSDGTMWFGTPSGLSALSGGKWKTFQTADGLPSNNINCLLEDEKGLVWAGTTGGLAVLRSERFEVPAKMPTVLREQILGLAEDRFGALWIATSNHVLQVKRDVLLRGDAKDGEVREYGLADGLRSTEGVKRQQSVVKDSMGRIWFSLSRGISVVDPGRLTRSFAPALPQIQTVTADEQPIRMGHEMGRDAEIPPGRHRIVFGFTGLVLSDPNRVRFRYQLSGYDHGWSQPSTDREASYTNLGPGSYHFRVIASNADGPWTDEAADVAFAVMPGYWQTWWFRTGALCFALLTALAAYRLRLHQLTDQLNLRFEERLAERTHIAQELHDTLLQGFLSACMHVDVAVDLLPSESPVKPMLTRSLNLMRQVTEEGRNAVRGLRSIPSSTLDLEQAFMRMREDLVQVDQGSVPVDFRVIVEGQRRMLHPVIRDEVYRIGREALTNAFRHAEARSIEMELTYTHSLFRMNVRDDGRGIDPEVLKEGRTDHWGLSGMRERADRIGARLRLFSTANGGSEVELSIPGTVAFQDRPRQPAQSTRDDNPALEETVR